MFEGGNGGRYSLGQGGTAERAECRDNGRLVMVVVFSMLFLNSLRRRAAEGPE
jgi:hypothetical protein